MQWFRDEAGGKLRLIHQAGFNTLADNIEAVQIAEKEGAEVVLLGYPTNFYATTSQQIYDYTKAFCDATRLGVILFPVPHWGFERVHPAGMDCLRFLVTPTRTGCRASNCGRCSPRSSSASNSTPARGNLQSDTGCQLPE